MEKFTKLTGVAAPMPLVNIDTDMIIPKQFLKTIKRTGLGVNLFDEMRYDREGGEIEDFVLNQPAYRNAQILVAGDNFGCGSSREHAPWALLDFGIRSVISTSFADIFYNNCFKNGILPIVVSPDDLETQTITGPDGGEIAFEVDAFKKHCLLNGLDDIGLTMENAAPAIEQFEARANAERPWV
jgi:3-isopropylmalate/(R)-2-methylmalate dehydratase small subunit